MQEINADEILKKILKDVPQNEWKSVEITVKKQGENLYD